MSDPERLALPTIPGKFWDARPLLVEVRDRAHARCAAADSVFATVLTSLIADSPARLAVETKILTPVKLTTFAGLVAPSGGGKSSGYGVGRASLPPGASVPLQVSTAAGVAEGFYGTVLVSGNDGKAGEGGNDGKAGEGGKGGDGQGPRLRAVRRRVRSNLMLHVDEGRALLRRMIDPGSDVGECLRSFWSGADLGQANAEQDRRRAVEAGTYVGGLVAGFQPSVAAELLADTELGTAQRWWWAACADPNIPRGRAAREGLWRADWGPRLNWGRAPLPGETGLQGWAEGAGAEGVDVEAFVAPPPVLMSVAGVVLDEIHAGYEAIATGESAPAAVDSHRTVLRVKLAGALAYLDARLDVTAEDWELAGLLVDTSVSVREALLEHAEAEAARAVRDRGTERAQVRAAETEAEAVRENCMRRLTDKLMEAGPEGLPRRDLVAAVSRPQRPFVAEALEAMIAKGEATETEAAHGGRRYRIGVGA